MISDEQEATGEAGDYLLPELKVNRILQSQGREMPRTRVRAMQYSVDCTDQGSTSIGNPKFLDNLNRIIATPEVYIESRGVQSPHAEGNLLGRG